MPSCHCCCLERECCCERLVGRVARAQDAFIGFGGNQVRDRVKNEAKWFVMDFSELIDAL